LVAEPRPLVLATRSVGKIRELTELCAARGIAVETLDAVGVREDPAEEMIEVYDSFARNAAAKARWFAMRMPGRVVLAEDSGLVVDALDGAPGVRSKRWAGSAATGAALDADNNAALERAMAAHDYRRARYECVAVIIDGDEAWIGDGRVEGCIARAPSGDGGFGYDPWFVSEELGISFGDAAAEEKARVSHRARAVDAVLRAGGASLRAKLATMLT